MSGLIGWLADVEVLARPSPWLSPMSFITAALLCSAAIALFRLSEFPRERIRWLAPFLGAAITFMGAWTICAYLWGVKLPVDGWLIDRHAAVGLSGNLNRMSPVSSVCFLLFGAAICFEALPKRRGGVIVQLLAAVGLMVALVSLIGYLYSIASLIELSDYKPIAPQTALAFCLSFVGIFLCSPDRGIMRTILSREIGGMMARRLLLFVFALPVLFGGLASAGVRVGILSGPTSIFFLTAATDLSLAGLLLFNAFTINRSEAARRTAQRSLAESERAYRTLFENAADPMFLVDRDLAILEANSVAATCLGRPLDALRGMNLPELTLACAPEMTRRLGQAFTEGYSSFETCGHTPDSRDVPMEFHARAVEFRGLPGVLIIARDLSERRRSERVLAEKEALLRQAQKMEAIGRLAGSVAHDFNNLLTVIMGYAELMLGKLPPSSDIRSEAFEIKMCATRAAALTRQLLTFSRRQPASPRATDVNTILKEMTPLLTRLIGEKIRLDVRQLARQSSIRIDPNQLEQIILNLAVNARDAMPEGGTLTIESRDRAIEGDPVPFSPAPADGAYVELVVQDTGGGIPPEVEPHIFEPFFTTKDESQGTGLGLSTVYGIVTQNSGAIGVQTSALMGTVMRVLFPFIPHEAARADTAEAEGMASRRTGTLLLVEDELAVREYLSQGLRRVGYNVLEADSGEAALQTIERYGGRIDVMVSDVVMPGISGIRLAQNVSQRAPGIRILFMSGYDAGDSGEIGKLCGGFDLITKPFTIPDLVNKIREGEALIAPPQASVHATHASTAL